MNELTQSRTSTWLARTAFALLVSVAPARAASDSNAETTRKTTGTRAADAVARIVIHKARHVMELVGRSGEIARYPVSLGPGGAGFKRQEGDRVTPVGHYRVVGNGPSASFTFFLRLDYPNADDRRRFAQLKASRALPRDATIGGDIGIHGGTPPGLNYAPDVPLEQRDWTLGCIAVQDDEIRAIARRTPPGTPVDIDDE